MFLRENLKYQQNDEGNILDCENVQIFKLARSHIHRFLLILVSCQYNVVYIAPYHISRGVDPFFGLGGGGGKSLKRSNFSARFARKFPI